MTEIDQCSSLGRVRRAVVTGAGGRVGRAIAIELGRMGAQVAILVNHSLEGGERTLSLVREAGGDGFVVAGDLAKAEEREHLAHEVCKRWDGIDLLVHNASAFAPVSFDAITPEHLDAMWGVHVRGPLFLTQALLPLLRHGGCTAAAASGEGGLVVAMLDIGAERPLSGYAAYSVSKAGLAMLVKAMAVELAPAVRAVGISPGQVIWPADYDEATRERLSRRVPMRRVGTPEDVAKLIRFIATEAPYLNGTIIPVDGGLSVRY